MEALSRVGLLLYKWTTLVIGFEKLKDQYTLCLYFANTYDEVLHGNHCDFVVYMIVDVYLFYESMLCIHKTSLHDFLIWELHDGDLVGHVGPDKTTILIADCFFFIPCLRKDVAGVVSQCRTC